MLNYVQLGVGKHERWKKVRSTHPLEGVAFSTVLSVDRDVDEVLEQGFQPEEVVKYHGPMYFDLDGEDIDDVLFSTRELLRELTEYWGIPYTVIKCFLSGKKGVHLEIPPEVMGVRGARLHLPGAYKKFMEEFTIDNLDRGVYSYGKGRMWRCTGVQRPDNGKFKVPVTFQELMDIDAEQYASLTSAPRLIDYDIEPTPAPKVVEFIKTALDHVRREWVAKQNTQESVSNKDLQASEETPQCITKLVMEGVCPESNWNQAAMQLACFIAAKYERSDSDKYQNLVDDLCKLDSNTYPTERDRQQEFKAQLGRAYSGSIKFYPGALIAALGKPCGNCIICTNKVEVSQEELKDENDFYCRRTKVHFTSQGVYLITGDDTKKPLINRKIKPIADYWKLEQSGNFTQKLHDAYDLEVGNFKTTVELPNFNEVRKLQQEFNGMDTVIYANDKELLRVSEAMLNYTKALGVPEYLRVEQSGVLFLEDQGHIIPHLVGREHSYRRGGVPSRAIYSGERLMAADYETVPDITPNSVAGNGLVTAIRAILNMNVPEVMTPAIGWYVASHLRTHLFHVNHAYPLLNLCGGSHSGKSSTAFILQTLNSFPYRKAPTWNGEVDTIYPLETLLATSATLVRTVEEANEIQVRKKWPQLVGILKAGWDAIGINKGYLSGRTVAIKKIKNDAPIVYLSEQSFPVQSVRTRSVVCYFSPATLEDPQYSSQHTIAEQNIHHVESFAKRLASTALDVTLPDIKQWVAETHADLPQSFTGRTLISYSTVLVGLKFLKVCITPFSTELASELQQFYDEYLIHLQQTAEETNREKSMSAVDDLLRVVDIMASEPTNMQYGLVSGRHYWRDERMVYIDTRQVFPRIRRFIRSTGQESSIVTPEQWQNLLEKEVYSKGKIKHPNKPAVVIHMLDYDKLQEKGVGMSHLYIGEPE